MNNTEKFKELYFALQSTTEQDESSEDYQQEKRQKKTTHCAQRICIGRKVRFANH